MSNTSAEAQKPIITSLKSTAGLSNLVPECPFNAKNMSVSVSSILPETVPLSAGCAKIVFFNVFLGQE